MLVTVVWYGQRYLPGCIVVYLAVPLLLLQPQMLQYSAPMAQPDMMPLGLIISLLPYPMHYS